MGFTHAAFQSALKRSLGIEVNLIQNEQFPKTKGQVFFERRKICNASLDSHRQPLSTVTDNELWEMMRSAMAFAPYPDNVTFDADTKTWDLFAY
jgi:hypothetical protein